MSLRIILWVVDIAAITLSILWYLKEPDYEPMITGILSVGGLITLLLTNKKPSNHKIKMIQKGGKKSKQYQSGGDMTINN